MKQIKPPNLDKYKLSFSLKLIKSKKNQPQNQTSIKKDEPNNISSGAPINQHYGQKNYAPNLMGNSGVTQNPPNNSQPNGNNNLQISSNNIASALSSINQMNHVSTNYFSNPRQETPPIPTKLDYNRVNTTESNRNYQTNQPAQNIHNPSQEAFYNNQYNSGAKSPSNFQKLQPVITGQTTKENIYKTSQNGRSDAPNMNNDPNTRKKDLNMMNGAGPDINYNKVKYQPTTSPGISLNSNPGSSNIGGVNHPPIGTNATKMFNVNTNYGNIHQGTIPRTQVLPETTSASNLNKNVPYSSNKYLPTNSQPGLGGMNRTGYKFNKDQ